MAKEKAQSTGEVLTNVALLLAIGFVAVEVGAALAHPHP